MGHGPQGPNPTLVKTPIPERKAEPEMALLFIPFVLWFSTGKTGQTLKRNAGFRNPDA